MRIFVNYRGNDTRDIAYHIYRELKIAFPLKDHDIFYSEAKDNIRVGTDFREEIAAQIYKSDIFLSIIGENWSGSRYGRYKFREEADIVCYEIKLALTKQQDKTCKIIPILVDREPIQEKEIPSSISKLTHIQRLLLRRKEWEGDIQKICAEIQGFENKEFITFKCMREGLNYLMGRYIPNHTIKKATLIQYSGETAKQLVDNLLHSTNAEVILYIQDEKTPLALGSLFQSTRIIGRIEGLKRELRAGFGSDLSNNLNRFRLIKYQEMIPASINAVKIEDENDDGVLIIGWYAYVSHKPDQDDQDTMWIHGSHLACILAWKGSNEYMHLNATFEIIEASLRNNPSVKI
jgi:hypothetical protein